MNIIIPKYIKVPEFSGEVGKDCIALLTANNKNHIAEHIAKVSAKCREIGIKYGLDESICELNGYLHDIGGIIKSEDMINFVKALGCEIYEAEEKYPFLLHQRISAILAEKLFNIKDERILSAVECHTTLKHKASSYDLALFVADKIAWDGVGIPPYYNTLVKALEHSLEKASIIYMDYIVENKMMLYPHKWFEEGRIYLANQM